MPHTRSVSRGDEAVETPWGGPTSACCHCSPDHCLRAHKQRLPKECIMRARHLRVAPPPGGLQEAIYARVSSDQQAERHTIDSQLAELKARAGQDGHQIREDMLFVDNGHSGASLIRPALERLRDFVALSAVEVVYVHAPDRLARSYAHQVLLLEEFARAGTQVVFLNRPIGDTPEDSLLLQLQGMFAEYERAKVLERSRRGKRYRAQSGAVSVLSRAPFGYRYVTREAGGGAARYEIDEDAARIVRQLFTWVGHERLTLAGVCRRLLGNGIPSPTGRRHWSRAMIHTMLLNPAYAGQAIYGRRQCLPWQPPFHPPRGHNGLPKRPYRQVPAQPSGTSASRCRRSWARACSRVSQSGWRRTAGAIASGFRASITFCVACWSARAAGMGSRAITTVGSGATIDVAAPIAAGSTASSDVMLGSWLWSCSMRRFG